MEEVDARAILGVSIEAPVSEIEAAYRRRVDQLRKSFEAARDRRTRTQLEREFAALEDARSSLLSEPEGAEEEWPASRPAEQILEEARTARGDPNTAKPPVEPIAIFDELKPGQVFAGRFELRRELSSDGTGVQWLAEDYSLRRPVALKFLPDVIGRDKDAMEDLHKELHVRIELKHPNIAQVYALIEDKGRVAVSMEYVDGRSLSQLRLSKESQVFEVKDLETWTKELCRTLEYFHKEAKLIHGGIRPNHLIVDPAGSLLLTDLGIARLINDSMIRLIGRANSGETLAYSSPQQAMREKLTIADDVYSLGANLYELLTSKPPFYTGEILVQIEEQVPPSMAERRAELGIEGEPIPKNWEETVAACLAKEPGRRPKSSLEVAQHLQKANSQSLVSPVPPLQPVSAPVQSAAPVKPVSAPVNPPSTPVEPVLTPVKRPPPSVHPVTSPLKPSQGPIRSVSRPVKPPQPPVGSGHTPIKPSRAPFISLFTRRSVLAIGGIIFVLALAAVVAFVWLHSVSGPEPGKHAKEPSPKPTAQPSPAGSTEQSTPSPVATPSSEVSTTPSSKDSATPNEVIPSPTPLSQPEIDATKEEVIKRINALPEFTAEQKTTLIEKMQKARSMERLTVIRFDIGQTVLHRAAADELVKAFEGPEMRDKLSDQTTILVVAGYADTGGGAEINLRISHERAENVTKILKRRAKLTNTIQTIGMGGTELLNSKRPDQNRAVEIWVVTPF
jgi:serine/threonine protein kinase